MAGAAIYDVDLLDRMPENEEGGCNEIWHYHVVDASHGHAMIENHRWCACPNDNLHPAHLQGDSVFLREANTLLTMEPIAGMPARALSPDAGDGHRPRLRCSIHQQLPVSSHAALSPCGRILINTLSHSDPHGCSPLRQVGSRANEDDLMHYCLDSGQSHVVLRARGLANARTDLPAPCPSPSRSVCLDKT